MVIPAGTSTSAVSAALGRIVGSITRAIPRRRAAAILTCACAFAGQACSLGESKRAFDARSAHLPADLRPVVLQALNEDGGPEFGIVGPTSHAASGERVTKSLFRAANPAHDFVAEFTAEGVHIVPQGGMAPLRLTLAHYGRAGRLLPAAMGMWESRGARIERRSQPREAPISEWYVNGPLGLEQGFTIDAAPGGEGPLILQLAIDESWSARARDTERTVEFVEGRSKTVLTYGELYAFDADGRPLSAALVPSAHGVAIRVEADDARYPITIDPFIQQQTLSVAGLAAGDEFGFSVAITADGSTAVVGAPGRDVRLGNLTTVEFADSGAAYVFVRTGQSWQLQAQLSSGPILSLPGSGPGAAETGRRFGHAVAVSNDTAVVTAPLEDVGIQEDGGVAYSFRRVGATWSLTQALGPPAFVARLGLAVAMDVSGSPELLAIVSDSAASPFINVYTRAGNPLWTRRGGTSFGAPISSLAVSGSTIVAGVPSSQRAFVAVSAPGLPVPFSSLLTTAVMSPDGGPSDLFGASVAISDDVMLVGAPGRSNFRGAGYVFRGSGTTWRFEQKLETDTGVNTFPGLGDFVAISPEATGGRAAVLGGLPVAGTADIAIFRRGTPSWTFEQGLVDSGGLRSLAAGVDSSSALPLLLLGTAAAGGSGAAVVHAGVLSAPGVPSPPPGGLGPPTLSPAVVTGSTVRLSWSAVSGATSYHLRAGTAPGASNAFDGNVGAVTTLTAASVPIGSYFVRVHAVGNSGESSPSNEVRVDVGSTGGCSPASSPTNLRATVNGALVTLVWNGAPGAVSYILEAGSGAGLANLATVDVGPGTTFMASAPPGTYFVRVRMRNACGATAVSNEIIVQVS